MEENITFKLIIDKNIIKVEKSDKTVETHEDNRKNDSFIIYTNDLIQLLNFINEIEINRYEMMSNYCINKWIEMPLDSIENERKDIINKSQKLFKDSSNTVKYNTVNSRKTKLEIKKHLDSVIRLGRAAGIYVEI